MSIAAGAPAPVALPREELSAMLPKLHLLEPVWRSPIVYRESVLFVQDAPNQAAVGKLLFPATKILSVHRADGQQTFELNRDYLVLTGGQRLALTEKSSIPKISVAELFPTKGAPRSLPHKAGDPERFVLFDNQHWFHDQQVEVTYEHAPAPWHGTIPILAEEELPKTLAKLHAGKKLTLAISGDSISQGYNASGYSQSPPWMPPYPDLVAEQLRQTFKCDVTLHNRAIGGWNVHQGLKDLDALLATKPDLIVIAYGMNDVGGRNPEGFRSVIASMLEKIRQQSADIEVILVAPMLGNADWVHTPRDMFAQYRDALKSFVGPGVALADLASIWQTLLAHKREVDLTGNGVNHPSDFGHRVYAQAILALLIPSKAIDAPAPAAEATKRFKMPAGFEATLFAGEPDLVQPIAFTFDDRGRVWVVENHSYPGWKGEKKDRVLILEDRDGDGHFDNRKVFLDNGSNLSGIEWGFGGIWLCSTPKLVFVADANHDDVPDSEPVIKLDGWDPTARHNVTSSLAWGVDGWLYGCNGILSNSSVGKPGTPDAERTPMNCGVWRYHPTRSVFEVVAHGTTNPWGLDFDQYGQTFITNCVIEHLWHAVPGARFQRMFGEDFNRHSYGLMRTAADHIHWAGGHWTEARGGERHDSAGGGHAHVGAMIYLGDNWPDSYRNHLFTCNIHGNRINQDVLERQGSGYVAHHAPDLMLANDPWFRGMVVKYGPDGGVFVSDWTDTGECHNYEIADRTNGRIYKITHGKPKAWNTDLGKLPTNELIGLVQHKNQFIARHSRRILQERHAAGQNIETVTLATMLHEESTDIGQLQAVWALHVVGATSELQLLSLLSNKHDVVRGWAVQLAVEDRQASPEMLKNLAELAARDSSPWVHLALAAALQRIPVADRWEIAAGLLSHQVDGQDQNLSLMIWYGVEPLVEADLPRALALAAAAKNPLVQQYIARRAAAGAEPGHLAALVKALADGQNELREVALRGMHEALGGRRRVSMPAGWSTAYRTLTTSSVPAIREQALLLALIFGDPQAVADLRTIAADAKQPADARAQAIGALAQTKAEHLSEILRPLLADSAIRVAVLRGLAAYPDEATPPAILQAYANFDLPARQEAVAALATRKPWALALLDAVENGSVPRGDISAFHVQQLQSLADNQVKERLAKVWGAARETAADRAAQIAHYKERLTPEVLSMADKSAGRAIFAKSCAACHTLFDAGGRIGPELTGAQRNNLDYVLSNVLDPSAVVARDYQMNLVQTSDGRVLNGIVKREDEAGLAIQTATELVVVPKEEIEARQGSPNSMMPDGLLQSLTPDEIRDLVAYLGSPTQVPLKTP